MGVRIARRGYIDGKNHIPGVMVKGTDVKNAAAFRYMVITDATALTRYTIHRGNKRMSYWNMDEEKWQGLKNYANGTWENKWGDSRTLAQALIQLKQEIEELKKRIKDA